VIQYALETDWLADAAGFEHLHSRIEIAKTLSSRRQDSNLCILKSDLLHFGVLAVVRDARNLLRSEARAPAIRDAQVRVLSPPPASPVSVGCVARVVRFRSTGRVSSPSLRRPSCPGSEKQCLAGPTLTYPIPANRMALR
jgi:hypothetical protein